MTGALLPEGFHDRLPPHADAAAALERALLDAARLHGYERVEPPLVEFEESLGTRLKAGATRKTWVTGLNPRPSHAAMSGETVGISERFSNGMLWPHDHAGGVDEVAGCNCSLSYSKE